MHVPTYLEISIKLFDGEGVEQIEVLAWKCIVDEYTESITAILQSDVVTINCTQARMGN